MKITNFIFFLISLSFVSYLSMTSYAQTTIKENSPKSNCAICDKFSEIQKISEGNESKAANQFADYISNLKLSTDAKLKKKELTQLIQLGAKLIYKDLRLEIGQYLVGFKDENPKLFEEILKSESAETQKLLNENEKTVRNYWKNGEKE